MRLVKFLSAVLSVVIGWVRVRSAPGGRQKLAAALAESRYPPSRRCKEPSAVMRENWTVKLESGVWVASWDGDPGRTLVEGSARGFDTRAGAEDALKAARSYRPFASAEICPPTTGPAAEALDTLVRAGLVNRDGTPTPFYDPNNTDYDHMPHAFGSWNPDNPDTDPDIVSG